MHKSNTEAAIKHCVGFVATYRGEGGGGESSIPRLGRSPSLFFII